MINKYIILYIYIGKTDFLVTPVAEFTNMV